jgi:hypothetical protein
MKYLLVVVVSLCLHLNVVGIVRADTVVTKSVWLEAMRTRLPAAFCRESEFFRKCFTVTEAQCIEEATRSTKECIKSLAEEMPAEFHQPADGTSWGRKLGECAGRGYSASLRNSKIESVDCRTAE